MLSSITCWLSVTMSLVADVSISQGSVATHLKCGGIFKHDFVANLLLSLIVEEFWKSVNKWQSYVQEFLLLFFIDSRCSLLTLQVLRYHIYTWSGVCF